MLSDLGKRLEGLGVALDAQEEAVAHLSRAGYDDANGARPLRRTIRRQVEDPAAELLLTTRDSIEHIATSVGFKNKNSFNREFKKRFGITPSEYRKYHRRKN